MDTAERYRRQLLEECRSICYETPISDATAAAFVATPRHLFVRRYRQGGTKQWHDVRADNLQEHLATLYANHPLILYGDDDDDVPSTISEPSLVLRMLDLLQLRPGQRVLELGTGSGWNAALMARLVGPEGHVHTVEIIADVAKTAAAAIEQLGIPNAHVIVGDGGEGYAPAAPYDRAVFTAGAYDLPRAFHEQLTHGGLLLAILKNVGGGDNLFLLRKTDDHLTSIDAALCGFVQVRGRSHVDDLEPSAVEALPGWEELRHCEISRTPFWWGGKSKEQAVWRTLSIRSFLGIVEPSFRAFKTAKSPAQPREEHFFGLWMQDQRSLVLAKDNLLISYGSAEARERLLECVRYWVDLGMPTAASLGLRVYPSDATVTCEPNEWLVKRPESKFVWSRPTTS
jgi:protein-L-isoaspartate(D-aspartate) O-methyltransferase